MRLSQTRLSGLVRTGSCCSTLRPDTSPSHAASVCRFSDNCTLISRVGLSPRDRNRQTRHDKKTAAETRRKRRRLVLRTYIPSTIKICDSFHPLPPRSDTCVLPALALCVCVCVCILYVGVWEPDLRDAFHSHAVFLRAKMRQQFFCLKNLIRPVHKVLLSSH